MIDELNRLTRVTKKNLKPAALTLAKAFQDYPVSVYFMPDAEKRRRKQPGIFESVIIETLNTGEVWMTSPAAEGVAIWLQVDKKAPPPKSRVSFEGLWMNFCTSRETARRQRAFFAYSQMLRERLMPDRYWYLQILGVHPAAQGKGFSSQLLKPVLARADREGLSCFVETQLEKNVALYERFGFKVMDDGFITDSEIRSWAMVRE